MEPQTTSPTSATCFPERAFDADNASRPPRARSRGRKPAGVRVVAQHTSVFAPYPRALAPRPRAHGGFSLIELLVVIGVLVLLAGILIPVVNRASKAAARTRTAADLAMIGVALEAYKADFAGYPQVDVENGGFAVLTKALIGPGPKLLSASLSFPPAWLASTEYEAGAAVQSGGTSYVALVKNQGVAVTDMNTWLTFNVEDGHEGPGFKTRATGSPVRGPYLQADKIKLNGLALLTSNGTPILYFPASPLKPTISSPNGYVNRTLTGVRTSLYNADDNLIAIERTGNPTPTGSGLVLMRIMLGDANKDGRINAGETARIAGPYLLWAAGNDGVFGPYSVDPARRTNPDLRDADACDDILSPLP